MIEYSETLVKYLGPGLKENQMILGKGFLVAFVMVLFFGFISVTGYLSRLIAKNVKELTRDPKKNIIERLLSPGRSATENSDEISDNKV